MNILHSTNQDYQLLTPDFMLDAIESLDIFPSSGLLALNSYENRVYQFSCDDGQRYVVKFYRPGRWTTEQIIEEHQFSIELADQEIPVVAPSKIGGQTLHQYQGFLFALFPCQGGRQFEVDNLDHLEWVGRFIGRIHQVGQQQPFQQRLTLDTETFLHQPSRHLEVYHGVPEYLKTPFNTVLEQLKQQVEQNLKRCAGVKNLRIFGDCHPGNILWTDHGPHFVDLDDSVNGPAIQDLWMMLNGDRANQLLQLDVLLEGYQEFCDFDAKELQLIEPLRAMRMINYMHWLAKRWDDPAFPHNFPWFNTDNYWEQQVLALKEQLAQLQQPCLQLPGQF
ncbi:serine/threonine protein kinase [Psychrobium sp. 1_MG-2023]|uniref:serine/threonine protein kinase n=1 Tax=Psychrobium sp. 1_MG-2023 TaxID=3062624 RepID=UPI000C328DF2|nr:serine/threonine protein kinase [Psychrobium sp. 1_MG-2023]MDP2561020.1 serine/threonine protein kinase [Psychrobium sp. 1_MG-2023]PKF58313.1 serine/threonine protein kinase [Alteromonadales bacterium alter-6D02]